VRDRHAVGCPQTAEAPTLHAALEALTLGLALDIDDLACDIMVGRDLGANVEQAVCVHTELMDDSLGLHFGLAEMAALRLCNILRLDDTCTKLDGSVAVTIHFANGNDLIAFECQNGDRHVPTIFLEQAGHPHLLRDHASTHDLVPS